MIIIILILIIIIIEVKGDQFFAEHINSIRTPYFSAGEDTTLALANILAVANILERKIIVYSAFIIPRVL